jgi:chromosome partitioning protein
MALRIAVSSAKGGVGKTTVCLNLALAMAERGRRTLLVDLDPQGGIGHSLGRGDAELIGLADLLMGQASGDQAVLQTKVPTLALLPRGRLDPTDVPDFEQVLHRPEVLAPALFSIEETFDIVMLDTPSGLGGATRGALAVADCVLIPFQAEPLALRSVGQLLRVIEHVRGDQNRRLRLLGILLTMVERTKEPAQAVLSQVWSGFEDVLDTVIPRADVFALASLKGVPIGFLGGRLSPEARRFELLASEVEARIAALKQPEAGDAERPQRELI